MSEHNASHQGPHHPPAPTPVAASATDGTSNAPVNHTQRGIDFHM